MHSSEDILNQNKVKANKNPLKQDAKEKKDN